MTGIFLGIESGGTRTALALVKENAVLARLDAETSTQHNEHFFQLLEQLSGQSGVTPAQLAGIGVAIGPGMFSALRVGLSVAKGIALTYSLPVKGINTLDAIASHAQSALSMTCGEDTNTVVVPLIDARKSEVYCAAYRARERVSDYLILPVAELSMFTSPVVFCGPGVVAYENTLMKLFRSRLRVLVPGPPPAEIVATEARVAIDSSGPDDVAAIAPFYLRRTDAELSRNTGGDRQRA